tara:strand:+ start:613 stop:966 length:354 start_codon:yes stop_codon:yes gene_type:complete
MSEIKKLIKTALENEGSSFKEILDTEISSRITNRLDTRKEEIASEVLGINSEEINESTFTFKSSGDVKKFMSAAMEAGVDKKVLKSKGKSVSVNKLKDSDMENMLELIAKDMKAKIS